MKQVWLRISIFVLLVTSSGCVCLTTCFNPYDWYKIAVDERDIKTQISDKTINAEILARYVDDEKIKALDISADSYEGDVYLTGEYESAEQKKQAETIAKDVDGVKSVTTHLLPKKELKDCGTTDNLAITANVKKALVGDGDIWATNVEVKAIQCKYVVLLGVVGSQEELDKSIEHAKATEGVESVKSFLRVKKGSTKK
jgi:hyperosmotically inducible protein